MATDHSKKHATLVPPSDLNPTPDPVLDFPDRDFGQLDEADYRALGFLSGLEVHQQLVTPTKLFCRCPSGVFVDTFDAEVLRHMRPTLSELGEYDGTALMEFKTRKEIVYRLDRGTVCTYEIDDTPPFEINEDAVKVALEIAALFDMDPVSELHVMRKQYLDGSIPTGFQRTAMVSLGGSIPFRVPELGIDRRLNIRQLSLEEDSCREVSDVGHRITFRTDRLGMPLTEVVTEPELFSPLELQAGARLVAETTRCCPRTRRGPGAARQDVNVSVAGGRRVEIKGVSHHRGLPRLVHNEAYRQLNLLRIREELRRRGVKRETLEIEEGRRSWEVSSKVIDATGLLRRSDFAPLHDALEAGGRAIACRLEGFRGLLLHRTQPGVPFATEIADRVRVIACLTGRPFLIHSDIAGYGLSPSQWQQLRSSLGADGDDSIVVVWGPERDVDTAAREIFLRAQDALLGVPSETRQSFPDATTGFERILPGADRMYPDTDTPPMPIPDAWVDEVSRARPARPWEREDRYRETGFPPEIAARLARAPWAATFDALKLSSPRAARRVEAALHRARRRLAAEPRVAPRLQTWARSIEQESIRDDAVDLALDRLLAETGTAPEAILERFAPLLDPDATLKGRVEECLEAFGELRRREPEAAVRWAMGRVMHDLRGRVDPRRALGLLEPALEARLEDTP